MYYSTAMEEFIQKLDFAQMASLIATADKSKVIVNPIILGDPYVWNYFHFTFDFLSKTMAASTYPCTLILCPKAVLANPVQRDLLCRHASPNSLMPIECPMLVRNPIIAYSTFSGKIIDDRRRRIGLVPGGKRRIFITRKTRKVHNMAEVQTVLDRYGFETVSFDDPSLSFDQQRGLLEGMGVMVALHGANMLNAMYVDGPVATIELASQAHANGALCFISNHLGREHWPIIGPPSGEREDFFVSTDALTQAIERFI